MKSHPCWSMMLAALAALAALVALFGPGALSTLAQSGPTSGPDVAPPAPVLSDAELAPLRKICQKMNQRQWANSIVETFEKAPAKEVWQGGQGTVVEYKGGRLIATAMPNGQGVIYRHLPAELKGSEAVRVEAWVQIHPMHIPNVKMAIEIYHNIMFAGDNPDAFMQWDYQYQFANGALGNSQWFRTTAGVGGQGFGVVQPVKAGHLMHLTFELQPQQFHCQRDEAAPLDGRCEGQSLNISGDTVVGFSALHGRFAVVQMAYRGLVAKQDVNVAEELKATSFKDQPSLTKFLTDRVVPHLDDPQYPARQAASDLLVALWPLSEPAVQAARPRTSTEADLRLAAVKELGPAVEVVTTQPDKPLPTPVAKDLPAEDDPKADKPAPKARPATQPAQPKVAPAAAAKIGPARKGD